MSQQFCLKWNSHTTNLLSVFKGFQSSETLVDVTLSCEGRNMKAHKLVLSACSPYFQNLFSENPCKHPIVIINGMRFTDIKAILDFMYKGEVNVSHDELSAFLKAAEALKVKGLTEVCGENQASKVAQVAPQVAETVVPPPPQAPPRADSPNKRRKIRKRSLSDSNRSDDGVVSRKREPSPEVHELSGDGYTGDAKHDGPTINSLPRVPPNAFSRSHHSSAASIGSEAASEDDDYEIEPSKLLEQTLTTDNVPSNNQLSSALVPVSSESVRGLQQKTSTPNLESSDMQGPDSPPDIKPMIQFDDSALSSGAGPSDGALVYSDQSLSQPGPSNYQDGALMLHDNSQSQGSPFYKKSKKEITQGFPFHEEPRNGMIPQGFPFNEEPRNGIIPQGFPFHEEPRNGIIPQGFPSRKEPKKEIITQGLPYPDEPGEETDSQGFPLCESPRTEVIPEGFSFHGEPRKEIFPQGFPVREEPKKEINPQGFPFCEELRKEMIPQDFPFREEPRKEMFPHGFPFREEPRKEIFPQGFPFREEPREEIIPRGFPPREEPKKEIITQGFPSGEERENEVTAQGFPIREEPREEMIPQGFPLREEPREQIIPQGDSQDFPLREEAREEMIPQGFPLREEPREQIIPQGDSQGFPFREEPREERIPQVPERTRYKLKVIKNVEVFPRHKKYKLSYVLEPTGRAGEVKIQNIDLLSYMLGLTSRRLSPFAKCFPMIPKST